ncbi:hypothetical protein DNTS_009830 [Danionella cerebrum]|uniref:Echinoderm microtubule-associated protein-like 1 n=1 Tax=Danionella cerebrum TaxID=2873325 RepID=A0A553MXN9_9TELE|nr:hypothetical protein DNTS_009830 [Danionella translucida]
MEELMDEAGASHTFSSECILPPDTDFSIDDPSPNQSALDLGDRLVLLEHRVQMQDDEIHLLKINIADVLKRIQSLQTSEEPKDISRAAHPDSVFLSPRASVSSIKKKSLVSSAAPSSASSRNYSPAPTVKRIHAGGAKDSPNTKNKVSSSGACRKPAENSKLKDGGAPSAGGRRVNQSKG